MPFRSGGTDPTGGRSGYGVPVHTEAHSNCHLCRVQPNANCPASVSVGADPTGVGPAMGCQSTIRHFPTTIFARQVGPYGVPIHTRHILGECDSGYGQTPKALTYYEALCPSAPAAPTLPGVGPAMGCQSTQRHILGKCDSS